MNLNDKNKVKVIKHYVVQGGSEKTVQLSLASSGSRKYFEDSGSGAGFKESIQGVASTTNNVINKNATKYYIYIAKLQIIEGFNHKLRCCLLSVI